MTNQEAWVRFACAAMVPNIEYVKEAAEAADAMLVEYKKRCKTAAPQSEFLDNAAPITLLVGPRRTGRTTALIEVARETKGRGILLCQSNENRGALAAQADPILSCNGWERTRNEWRKGGAYITVNCINNDQLREYQGAEFQFVGIDEAQQVSISDWYMLMSRMRGETTRMRCTLDADDPRTEPWIAELRANHAVEVIRG